MIYSFHSPFSWRSSCITGLKKSVHVPLPRVSHQPTSGSNDCPSLWAVACPCCDLSFQDSGLPAQMPLGPYIDFLWELFNPEFPHLHLHLHFPISPPNTLGFSPTTDAPFPEFIGHMFAWEHPQIAAIQPYLLLTCTTPTPSLRQMLQFPCSLGPPPPMSLRTAVQFSCSVVSNSLWPHGL